MATDDRSGSSTADAVAENSNQDSGDFSKVYHCGVCDDVIELHESFRCESCDVQTNTQNNTAFCKYCIAMLHVRKGHVVIDHKGYKPAICPKHRMLCLMFCYDCNVVFCLECLEPHCSHKYFPVSKKATEVRKEVFQYLDSFDELSKPFKRRENEMQHVLDERQRYVDDLSPEKLEETVSKCFLNAIRLSIPELAKPKDTSTSANQSNAEVIDETRHNSVRRMSQEGDESVIRLRELLLMSEGVSVTRFLEATDQFGLVIKEQNAELDKYVCLEWCSPWVDIGRDCIEKSVHMFQVPKARSLALQKLKSQNTNPFSVTDVIEISLEKLIINGGTILSPYVRLEYSEIFNVRSIHGVFHFSLLLIFHNVNNRGNIVSHGNIVKNFSVNVDGISSLYCINEYVGFTHNAGTLLLDVKKKSFADQSSSASIPNYSLQLDDDMNYTVFRNVNPLVPNFSDDDSKNVSYSPVKPKLVTVSGNVNAFVENNTVTIVNTKTKVALQVLPIHHQLQQIDGLIFRDTGSFLLFDYKARIVLSCAVRLESMSSTSWGILKAEKFEIPSDESVLHCSINRISLFLVTEKNVYQFCLW